MSDRKEWSLEGELYFKGETQQVSERFRKRDLVIKYEDNPMYPQYLSFQLVQDRCELLDKFELGNMMKVDFNLRGREWAAPDGTKKYFNTLEAWRLNISQTQTIPPVQGADVPFPAAPPDAVDVTESDDLPF